MGASDWGSVTRGTRDLGGEGEGGIYVRDRERKGGAARERECSVCVNVFACNWIRNGQWIE